MDRFLVLLLMVPLTCFFWPVAGSAGGDSFGLQVSAFQERNRAVQDVGRFKGQGYEAFFRPEEVPGKGIWHRVYIGRFPSKGQALEQAQTLKARGVISDYMIRRLSSPPAVNTAAGPEIPLSGLDNVKKETPPANQLKTAAKDELLLEFIPEPEPVKKPPLAMGPIPDMGAPKHGLAPVQKNIVTIERKLGTKPSRPDLTVKKSGETVNAPKQESVRFGFPGERQPLSEWDVSGQKSNRIAVKKVSTPRKVTTGSGAERKASPPLTVKKEGKQGEATGMDQKQPLAESGQAPLNISQTKLRTYLKGTDDTPDPTSSDSFNDERENESSVGFSLVTTF